MYPSLSAQEFVAKWQRVELKERSASQSQFNDLCRLVGHPTPVQEVKRHNLTNLYKQRPIWLDLAHRKLDGAVMDAYGWPHDLSDEEILERLPGLNFGAGEGRAITDD